jgi:hypothetical protein
MVDAIGSMLVAKHTRLQKHEAVYFSTNAAFAHEKGAEANHKAAAAASEDTTTRLRLDIYMSDPTKKESQPHSTTP